MQNDSRLNRIFAFVVFIISFLVYLRTVAPTTSFWDCGEFITCSHILGVPHPPGAPLYILVGRIFSMVPFVQDIGMRVNIISALASAITVVFTYLIIVRLITMFQGKPKDINDRIILYASGIIGALTFAFTDSFWFNAVEAEVYAISVFFTSLVIWLILVWWEKADDPTSDKYILLIAYAIGLAIGVHLLMILALPVVILIIYFRKYQKIELANFAAFAGIMLLIFFSIYPGIVKWIPNVSLFLTKKAGAGFTWFLIFALTVTLVAVLFYSFKERKRILFLTLTSLLLILIATSTYTAIYIRSNLNPAIDENDPENMENMVSYLNREQYGDWGTFPRRYPGLESKPEFKSKRPFGNYAMHNLGKQLDFMRNYQINKMYLRYFGWQFIGQGTTLGEDGRIVENFSLNGLWMIPFLIGLLGMYYHFRKDWKHASAIGLLFFITGLAIVIYLNQEDPQPRERDYVYVGSFFAFSIWIGMGVTAVGDIIKKITEKFQPAQKMVSLVAGMLILCLLPIHVFRHNFESHNRSGNYVAYDYSHNILESCEPNAILFTNGDNDTFPLWFLQEVYGIRKDVRVVNLSLLNTHWYIKQLRDEEPRVPINLNDRQIEILQPRGWPKEGGKIRFDVPKNAYLRDRSDLPERKQLVQDVEDVPEIAFTLKPTLYGQGIRVQDMMILEIIRTNRFRKPVYFALTVSQENQINLREYLRMDGLVFKLVTYPTREDPLSPVHLKTNLFEKFQYRNLTNEDVFYNENIKGLLRNYQGAYYSLAQYFGREKMLDEMTEVLDTLTTVMPDTIIPMRKDLQFEIGRMYYIAGKHEKFKDTLLRLMERRDVQLNEKLQYAGWFSQLYPEDAEQAVTVVEKLRNEFPDSPDSYYWLASNYMRSQKYQPGIDVLNQWLVRNPNDKNASTQIQQLKNLIIQSQKDTTPPPDTTMTDSLQN